MKHDTEFSNQEIEKLLDVLRDVPPREEDSIAKSREAYLEAVANLPEPVSKKQFLRLKFRKSYYQLRFRTLTIAVLLSTIFGGGAITVGASQTSLPGENLYPLKIWIENIRMGLTSDGTKKIELHLIFASERLDEINQLESMGISDVPEEISVDFIHHIEDASQLLSSETNQSEYEQEIDELLTEYGELEGEDIETEDSEEDDQIESQQSEDDEEDQETENSDEDESEEEITPEETEHGNGPGQNQTPGATPPATSESDDEEDSTQQPNETEEPDDHKDDGESNETDEPDTEEEND